MAKLQIVNEPGSTASAVVAAITTMTFPVFESKELGAITFNGESLTLDGLKYIIRNGVVQAVRDSVAGLQGGKASIRAQIEGKDTPAARVAAFDEWATYAAWPTAEEYEYDGTNSGVIADDVWASFMAACAFKVMQDKLTDVVAGDVGTRVGGPRRNPAEKERDDIAIGLMFRVMTDESKKAWNDPARTSAALRAKYVAAWRGVAANEAAVQAEVDSRNRVTAGQSLDLTSLLPA